VSSYCHTNGLVLSLNSLVYSIRKDIFYNSAGKEVLPVVLVLDVVEFFFDSLTGVVDAQLQTGTRPTLESKMTQK
jgi:hypothetical protein